MSFRFSRGVVLILSMTLVFTGCDRFLRSSKPLQGEETIQVHPAAFDCLKDWPDALKQYLNDEASEISTGKIFSCLQSALGSFQKYTKGESLDLYGGQELQHYLNRYLLKKESGYQISDALMVEIMKIKVFMVGGSPISFTRSEMDQFSQMLSSISEEAQKLRGFWKLLLLNEDRQLATEERLRAAQTLLSESLLRAVRETKAVSSSYQWSDVRKFVTEVDKFYGTKSVLGKVLEWAPLIEVAKNLFLGRNEQLDSLAAWTDTLNWINDTYFVGLRTFYHFEGKDLDSGTTWKSLIALVDSLFDLLDRAPQLAKAGQYPVQDIDELIDVVAKQKLVNFPLSLDLMKTTYRQVIALILGGPSGHPRKPSEVRGLTKSDMVVLRSEYYVWRIAQNFINDIFDSSEASATLQVSDVIRLSQRFDVQKVLVTAGVPFSLRDSVITGWKDWARILRQPRPFVWSPTMKLNIRYQADYGEFSFVGLSTSNALRMVTRFLLRGYGDGRGNTVWNYGISEGKMRKFIDDFWELGLATGALDPRNGNIGTRMFREMNYLLSQSDGDELLTASEILEELHVLFSAGKTIGGEIVEGLKKENCSTGEQDRWGRPVFNEGCFHGILKRDFSKFYGSMPDAAIFFGTLASPADQDAVLDQLISIAGIKEKRLGTVEVSEILAMSTVLHYLELMMVTFDQNQDQLLSEAEVRAAAPRFRSFIRNVSPEPNLDNSTIDNIFLFIVFEGRKPSGRGEITKFIIARGLGIHLPPVGRGNLLKVLATLSQLK